MRLTHQEREEIACALRCWQSQVESGTAHCDMSRETADMTSSAIDALALKILLGDSSSRSKSRRRKR